MVAARRRTAWRQPAPPAPQHPKFRTWFFDNHGGRVERAVAWWQLPSEEKVRRQAEARKTLETARAAEVVVPEPAYLEQLAGTAEMDPSAAETFAEAEARADRALRRERTYASARSMLSSKSREELRAYVMEERCRKKTPHGFLLRSTAEMTPQDREAFHQMLRGELHAAGITLRTTDSTRRS